jgi:hypothetical protein
MEQATAALWERELIWCSCERYGEGLLTTHQVHGVRILADCWNCSLIDLKLIHCRKITTFVIYFVVSLYANWVKLAQKINLLHQK